MTRHVLAIAVVISAIAVAPVSVALAHPGHAHNTMGTVKSIQEKHLEVLDKDGKTSMFMITKQTKITRGKTAASWADVKVGQRVVVVATMEKTGGMPAMAEHGAEHGGPMTATEIRLGAVASTGGTR